MRKESWAWQTLYQTDKNKIVYTANEVETEIDFVLVGEKYIKYIRDVKVIQSMETLAQAGNCRSR